MKQMVNGLIACLLGPYALSLCEALGTQLQLDACGSCPYATHMLAEMANIQLVAVGERCLWWALSRENWVPISVEARRRFRGSFLVEIICKLETKKKNRSYPIKGRLWQSTGNGMVNWDLREKKRAKTNSGTERKSISELYVCVYFSVCVFAEALRL